MAEITKVTTPIVPRENMGSRNKPVSDQAFDLTDPSKVHKPGQEGRVQENRAEHQALRDQLGRGTLAPILRDTTELLEAIHKVTYMLQMGLSTSDIVNDPEVQNLLATLFLTPDQLLKAIKEQDRSAVLFKGAAFDVLRDIMGKFEQFPRIKEAVAELLKTFEYNVNSQNSVKTILLQCMGLLDYMFTKDREQFSEYLDGLTEMLLPQPEESQQFQQMMMEELAQAAENGELTPQQEETLAQMQEQQQEAQQTRQTLNGLAIDQKEAAQILKGNLLPLLGEIVVKYHQNEHIRDMVMVVVHNIVRVDQGTPEALQEAVARLVAQLRLAANLPDKFEQNLMDAVFRSCQQVKNVQDETLSKLAEIITRTLSDPQATAGQIRQTEALLMSLLQNQSAVMNVMHFILPMELPEGKLFAEMYVDPDSEERVGRNKDAPSRKIFIAVESEQFGNFEISFLETGQRVDFAMWCPEVLVPNLGKLRKTVGNIMQTYGYTMNSYKVDELKRPSSIAEVFPRLLGRRVGIDVKV